MSLETPFQLHVSDIDLENLHHKLRLTRFPDELADEDWDYGVPLADIKRLVARWQTGFDWRSCERAINDIPQYTRAAVGCVLASVTPTRSDHARYIAVFVSLQARQAESLDSDRAQANGSSYRRRIKK